MIISAEEVVELFFKPVVPGIFPKISTTKIYRLAKKGKIPSFKLDGRIFFDEDAIRDWLKSKNKIESSTEVLQHYGRDRKMRELPEDMSTDK
jgi:hypothetical protein